MLTLVQDVSDVQQYQTLLHSQLLRLLPEQGNYTLGFPGGNFTLVVSFNSALWYAHKTITKGEESRYWNAFGIGERLRQSTSNSIIVEVNFPIYKPKKQVAGLFASDQSGRIFVLHRGTIGGRSAASRNAFQQFYPQEKWVDVDEGAGHTTKAILITSLQSDFFLEDFIFFVQKVDTFKQRERARSKTTAR